MILRATAARVSALRFALCRFCRLIFFAPTSDLKVLTVGVCALLFTVRIPAEAQQVKKPPRIGVLEPATSASIAPRIEAFRRGLRDLGYVEGQNVSIEYRFAEGKPDRIPQLAADLVALKPEVILTSQTPTVLAIKKISSTIPIVFVFLSFPVENGIVASFARPGGNATGMTVLSEELNGKRLELLKETSPTINLVGVMSNPNNPTQPFEWKGVEAAAATLGLRLEHLPVRNAADVNTALAAALKSRVQGLMNLPEAVFTMNRKRITEFTIKNKLPAICSDLQAVGDGCLMAYGPDQVDLYRRAAAYVDKILKGASPGDLPVEQPKKFELLINLQTAKKSGLTIPPAVLAHADRVIR